MDEVDSSQAGDQQPLRSTPTSQKNRAVWALFVLGIMALLFVVGLVARSYYSGHRSPTPTPAPSPAVPTPTPTPAKSSKERLLEALTSDPSAKPETQLEISIYYDLNGNKLKDSGEDLPISSTLQIKGVENQSTFHLLSTDGVFRLSSFPPGDYVGTLRLASNYWGPGTVNPPDLFLTDGAGIIGPRLPRDDQDLIQLKFSLPPAAKTLSIPLVKYVPQRLMVTVDKINDPSLLWLYDVDYELMLRTIGSYDQQMRFGYNALDNTVYYQQGDDLYRLSLATPFDSPRWVTSLANVSIVGPHLAIADSGGYFLHMTSGPSGYFPSFRSLTSEYPASLSLVAEDGQVQSASLELGVVFRQYDLFGEGRFLIRGYTKNTSGWYPGVYKQDAPYPEQWSLSNALRVSYVANDKILVVKEANSAPVSIDWQNQDEPETVQSPMFIYDLEQHTSIELSDKRVYWTWLSPDRELLAFHSGDLTGEVFLLSVGNALKGRVSIKQVKLPEGYVVDPEIGVWQGDMFVISLYKLSGCTNYCSDRYKIVRIEGNKLTELLTSATRYQLIGYYER